MAGRLRRLAAKFPDEIGRALYLAALEIMRTSKRDFVPVDLGPLRASGHVRPPDRKGKQVSVSMVYGGPAARYAIVQHENLDYEHEVGEAKYLEKPMFAAAPTLTKTVAQVLGLEKQSV